MCSIILLLPMNLWVLFTSKIRTIRVICTDYLPKNENIRCSVYLYMVLGFITKARSGLAIYLHSLTRDNLLLTRDLYFTVVSLFLLLFCWGGGPRGAFLFFASSSVLLGHGTMINNFKNDLVRDTDNDLCLNVFSKYIPFDLLILTEICHDVS